MSEKAMQKTNKENGVMLAPQTMEKLIIQGDLSKLTPAERVKYYTSICESVGLNPLTKPFEYLVLDGKLTLYAGRNATDQLCVVYGISTKITQRGRMDDLYFVHVTATDRTGRSTDATGVVSLRETKWAPITDENGKPIRDSYGRIKKKKIPGELLRGDALANAFMKAETKAKRRAVLALVGLSFLDETEVETIPDAKKVNLPENGELPTPPAQLSQPIENTAEVIDVPTGLEKNFLVDEELPAPPAPEIPKKEPEMPVEEKKEVKAEDTPTKAKRGRKKANKPKKEKKTHDFPYWKNSVDGVEYLCARPGRHLPADFLAENGFREGRNAWFVKYSEDLEKALEQNCIEYENSIKETEAAVKEEEPDPTETFVYTDEPPVGEYGKEHIDAIREGFRRLKLNKDQITEVLELRGVPLDTDQWDSVHFQTLINYLGNAYIPPKLK